MYGLWVTLKAAVLVGATVETQKHSRPWNIGAWDYISKIKNGERGTMKKLNSVFYNLESGNSLNIDQHLKRLVPPSYVNK